MTIEIIKEQQWMIRAFGEIDLFNVGEVQSALDSLVEGSPQGFVVDLSATSYMDSAGISVLLATYRKIQPTGGKMALIADGTIRRIIELTRLSELPGFYLCDDVTSAQQVLVG